MINMTKTILLIIFATFILQINSQKKDHVLALSWLGGHCYSQQLFHDNNPQKYPSSDLCGESKLRLWDHQSFTIHGLWYHDMVLNISYNIAQIQKHHDLFNDMQNFWPPVFRQVQPQGRPNLWEHQWEAHGGSYIYHLQNPNNLERQVQFFQDTINFYKRFPKLQKIQKGVISKSQLAQLLGITTDQFSILCAHYLPNDRSLYLKEIRICFKRQHSGNKVVNCTKQSQTCKSTEGLILEGWEVTNQQKVTNYESDENVKQSDEKQSQQSETQDSSKEL